jgi:hypothetical protein
LASQEEIFLQALKNASTEAPLRPAILLSLMVFRFPMQGV